MYQRESNREGFAVRSRQIEDLQVDARRTCVVVELGLDDQIHLGADGELGLKVAHLEGNAAEDVRAALHRQLQVRAGGADAAGRSRDADRLDEETRMGIAAAERGELIQHGDGARGRVFEREQVIELERRNQHVLGEVQARVVVETGAEGLELVEGELHPAGHGVAATGGQQVAAVFDGQVEFKARDRAGGAVRFAGGSRKHESGSMVKIDDA